MCPYPTGTEFTERDRQRRKDRVCDRKQVGGANTDVESMEMERRNLKKGEMKRDACGKFA